MQKIALLAGFAAIALVLAATQPADAKETLSNAQVRQQIIQDSLASYPGRCPCPYNIMRNGRVCGGRSAYSRPGGYAPLCYENDVSDEMVKEFRKSHGD